MNPDIYFTVRLIHVLGALGLFVVVGSEWSTHLALAKARTTGEVQRILPGFALARITPLYSMVCVVLPGFYLVHALSAWRVGWVHLAITSVVALSVLGGAVSARRLNAIRAAVVGADQPLSSALAAQIHDPLLWNAFALRVAIMGGMVVMMVMKPSTVTAIGIMAVAVVLGVIFGKLLNGATTADEKSTAVETSPG